MEDLLKVYVQFFFLLTPFVGVSVFLSMTSGHESVAKRKIALRTTISVLALTFCFLFFGDVIFKIFGITLNAFRIGAGTLLFLSAISLVGKSNVTKPADADEDFAVVPLAMPVIVGPATIGALIVYSVVASDFKQKFMISISLFAAVISMGILLFISNIIHKILGRRGLAMMTKLSGFLLASLAAQIIFDGILGFLK